MKLTLILADSAQAVNGKLYILGGGWSITDPANINMSIAIKIEVPWTAANAPHNFHLVLVTEDGQPVRMNNQVCEVQGALRLEGLPDCVPGPRSMSPLQST